MAKRRLTALVAIRGLGRREALGKRVLLKAAAKNIKPLGQGDAGGKASR